MVRLPHLLALLCGLAAALAIGCGGDRSNLIPASRSAELQQQLTDLQASITAGECDGLSGRVQAFHDDAADLGGAVDKRLRARINDGAASLQEHAVSDCQAAADAAQQTETQPSDTTPEETQTDTTTTETTPTETVPSEATPPTTTTPTTSIPETPAEPTPDDGGEPAAGTGGATPDEGDQGP